MGRIIIGGLWWVISAFIYAKDNIPKIIEIPAITIKAEQPTTEEKITQYKKEVEQKIIRAWDVPIGSSGQKAVARILLGENGEVTSLAVSTHDPDVKSSIEVAIRSAAPFDMPDDAEVRKMVRSFVINFTAR